ncbi:MAG: transcription antitermination factor NusB [Micrococcales bacterium]|nr:transcription antitermination factor NusB [Micrococcales bacterium]
MSRKPNVTRLQARRRAVEILFEADQRGIHPKGLLEDRLGDLKGTPVESFTRRLVDGVGANLEEINEEIATYSRGWPPERMPAVDRAIARLGTFEILHARDVPSEVVLEQAADLAAELSTDRSPDFLSGLLGRLAEVRDAFGDSEPTPASEPDQVPTPEPNPPTPCADPELEAESE